MVPHVPAFVAVLVMRARFVGTPITTDEGGYLAVARAWSRGATLYLDTWVDRPQGLLVLFRAWNAIGLGSPEGIRIMAIVFCLVAVVACADVAATLAGERARPIAALLTGVLLSVPQLEGFIANGELLAGATGAAALALVLRATWTRPVIGTRPLLVAGVVAGCALSLKQSGFDGFGAAVVAFGLAWWRAGWSWRTGTRASLALGGGFCVPLAAMAVHGALTGWDRWWSALVGYRLGQRQTDAGSDWEQLRHTAAIAAPVVAPSVLVLVVLLVGLLVARRITPGAVVVLATWGLLAGAAFMVGGHFHRHYWLLVMPPLATALAVAIAALGNRAAMVALTAALSIVPAVMAAHATTIPRVQVGDRLSDDSRVDRNESVARWIDGRAAPDDSVWAMCASAGLYGVLESDPPFPYLWFDGVQKYPGAMDKLLAMLASESAPRFVVQYQSPGRCDPKGRLATIIEQNYREVDIVAGLPVFERTRP